jgi:hypothetical protein
MSTAAWAFRFLLAFAVAAAALAVVQLAKGANIGSAATFAAVWGALTALVFTGVGYIKYKRNPACMIKPTPEK